MSADSKDEHEWAWEFHKQCDLLLHSRLTAYFIGHSFLISAFTMFVINRQVAPAFMPYVICIAGLATAFMWLFVNVAMYARLEALNERYLCRGDEKIANRTFASAPDGKAAQMREVFTFYIRDSIREKRMPWTPIHVINYKTMIPYVTPWVFIFVWAAMTYTYHFQIGFPLTPVR